MSDIHNPVPTTTEVNEPTATAAAHHPTMASDELPQTDAPLGEAHQPEVNGVAEEPQGETAAAAAPTTALPAVEDKKPVEPITEGLLSYKGPGVLKSIIPSKKDVWLSDAPLAPNQMGQYMRGEKPEISNPIVAWASQTGRGLLFFNKKSDLDRKHPGTVLPLYEATDLHKSPPHEIVFKIHGNQHTLKAANDAERDGWYLSLEKAIELGKAQKEATRNSEGYKAEMATLNKPNLPAGGVVAGAVGAAGAAGAAGVAGAGRSTHTTPKKSIDGQKDPKSRSTSRGMLDRFKQKKDEAEAKREEKAEEKEEKKVEKEEAKHHHNHKDAEHVAEAAVPAAAVVGGATALDAKTTADRALDAPVETSHTPLDDSSAVKDTEALPESKADEKLADSKLAQDKPKVQKRGSIFGKMQAGFGSIRSPGKEKDLKDAELKPQVPPKDLETAGISETAPQLPDPVTAEPTLAKDVEAPAAAETGNVASESKPVEAAKEKLGEAAPASGQKGFLSGLPFLNKRNRSVSPSTNLKEQPVLAKKEETPVVPTKDESVVDALPSKSEEPIVAAATSAAAAPIDSAEKTLDTPAAEKPFDKAVGEPKTTETPNKRASVLGNLGRRASKALNRIQAPVRKENVAAPGTTAITSETKKAGEVAAPAEEKALVNGETAAKTEQPHAANTIGDVGADAVHTGEAQAANPAVTASA